MQITFFSFSMAVLWSSLLITMIYLFRKNYLSIQFYSISGLLLLYVFCLIRIVLPLEVPFTKVVVSKYGYNQMVHFFQMSLWEGNGYHLKVGTLLFGLWAIGAVIKILRYTYYYIKSTREIKRFEKKTDLNTQTVMDKILQDRGDHIRPAVLVSSSIHVPMGVGIFKKYILLPDKDYTDRELYHILLHEYTHLLHGDLVIKMLIDLICCIYWWNPIVYLLRKDLGQTLEIKCDLEVTRNMGNGEKADYLEVIVSAIRGAKVQKGKGDKQKGLEVGYVNLFNSSFLDVKERFQVISSCKGAKLGKKANIITFFVFLVVLFFSYSFVVQSKFEVPVEEVEADENAYIINSSGNYIIKREDGYYEILMKTGKNVVIDEQTALKMQELGYEIIE